MQTTLGGSSQADSTERGPMDARGVGAVVVLLVMALGCGSGGSEDLPLESSPASTMNLPTPDAAASESSPRPGEGSPALRLGGFPLASEGPVEPEIPSKDSPAPTESSQGSSPSTSGSWAPPKAAPSRRTFAKMAPLERKAVEAQLEKAGSAAQEGHPVADVDLPAHVHGTPIDPVTLALQADGQNALLQAALFAETGEPRYERGAVRILEAWATTHRSLSGANGWLVGAWSFGAMTRAATVLRATSSSEWKRIEPVYGRWIGFVASRHWLPPDPKKPPTGYAPQLLQKWENDHVSNRTLAALEATMHAADVLDDERWLETCQVKFQEVGPKYFHADGLNEDEPRGDPWHPQAGIASAIQMLTLLRGRGTPGLPKIEGLVRLSAETYASRTTSQFIPLWTTVVTYYGADAVPKSVGVLKLDNGSFYTRTNLYGVQYLWGLGSYL